jgi:hypothetical protein
LRKALGKQDGDAAERLGKEEKYGKFVRKTLTVMALSFTNSPSHVLFLRHELIRNDLFSGMRHLSN